MVWQRIIPEIGSKCRYLMHLLLALGSIHMITQQAETSGTSVFEDSDTVDLTTILEHHQKGLEGFKEEVSRISPFNAEHIFTGSLLLVGFAFAALKVQELNPSSTNIILHLNWLNLNRGVLSVLQDDQWHVLKASRLRQMVVFSSGNEPWMDLPFEQPSRLSSCSPRLLEFAEGAIQAVANIKASLHTLESAMDDLSSCSGTPASQSSPSTTLDWAVNAHTETIRILDTLYLRILSILRVQ